MITRVLVAALIVTMSAWAWVRFDIVSIEVVGQPASTGFIQSNLERPFFEGLASNTGLPIRIRYRSLEMVGYKDTYQLSMLKDGSIDLVSLRFIQNSSVMPELMGVDLAGLNVNFETGRSVVRAYSDVIDQRLQSEFGAKLLSIWPFGPQVMFCRKPISSLRDIEGFKVRIAGPSLESLVTSLNAIPVSIAYDDVLEALRIGLIDCAVTSSASANFSGWPKYTTHFYPITLTLGLNGHVIRLATWKRLSPGQQKVLLRAFEQNAEAIWSYAETIHSASAACNTGAECNLGVSYKLTNVVPSMDDIQFLQETMKHKGFEKWSSECDQISENCSRTFRERLPFVFSKK